MSSFNEGRIQGGADIGSSETADLHLSDKLEALKKANAGLTAALRQPAGPGSQLEFAPFTEFTQLCDRIGQNALIQVKLNQRFACRILEVERSLGQIKAALDASVRGSAHSEKAIGTAETRSRDVPRGSQIPKPRIVVLCEGVKREGLIEAIKKEAWAVYSSMRLANPHWEILFASVEEDDETLRWDSEPGILYVPRRELGRALDGLNPSLIHLFSAHLTQLFGYNLTGKRVLFTAVADAPEYCATDEQLEEVRHWIDIGTLIVVPESEPSWTGLDRANVKAHEVIYPGFTPAPPHSRGLPGSDFTVGFASSPFLEEQWKGRGIDLVLALAETVPQTRFLMAWRTDATRLYEELSRRRLKNVEVQAGTLDMERFYERADAMILPFAETGRNHASPFSAIEGLLRGRPVLATRHAGIAGLLESGGVGVATEATVEGLAAGLERLKLEYEQLASRARPFAQQRFGRNSAIGSYQALYREMIGRPLGPSLQAWRVAVRRHGKVLVKGREKLKAHYAQEEVAQSYSQQRFLSHPHNLIDRDERAAVQQCVEIAFPDRHDLRILDIATGEGRILRSIAPYGACTAVDNSQAMLRLAGPGNPGNCRYIFADFFAWRTDEKFDVITCFRLLRHFDYPDRREFYERVKSLLQPRGLAVIDVPSPRYELLQRARGEGWAQYPIYDVFWTVDGFQDELRRNGLALRSYARIGCGLHDIEELQRDNEPFVVVAAFGNILAGQTPASEIFADGRLTPVTQSLCAEVASPEGVRLEETAWS